jgi:hypothetical protein
VTVRRVGAVVPGVLRQLMSERPDDVGKKYPELFHWRAAADAARGNKPTGG